MATVAGMRQSRPTVLELLNGGNAERDYVAAGIRDAARAEFELVGIRRANMIDIARRAGVSRTTLYRRFPDRESLVEAVAAQETEAAFIRINSEVAEQHSAADGLVCIFVASVRELRSNAILRRLQETEPEVLLHIASVTGRGLLGLGRRFVLEHLDHWQREGSLPAGDLAPAAEVLVRLIASVFLTPEGVIPVDDEAKAAAFLRRYVLPVFGLVDHASAPA